MNWLMGASLAGMIAVGAHRAHLLTPGGALTAALIGTVVFGVGGVWASIPMVAFFLSGSLLPRIFGRPHKTERRTAFQVLANGLAPALCCVGVLLYPDRSEAFWFGYAAGLATATADTWATEFGMRFSGTAWLITTGKRVTPGESGAVSAIGTVGGSLGAWITASLCTPLIGYSATVWMAGGMGVLGMFLDSLLGATIQARFRCHTCGAAIERRRCCNATAHPIRGIPWIDNNAVNLLSTLTATGIAILWGFA
ncbi:MAG: hypothetical protein CFK49_03405 [Armatimonadetes bacterium JP3_11]|jgi:uncharacterized protein (TIGR00297 family)|nr:MAG: hypothetical protein CFK48_03660 [Armatimonadetes bacterium CP1_7O]OYT75391.1 MAG: hypothetical protein CFK49_03405 [Armatimonadetes bacterium JP3_11]RMH07970.1 MAG: DUF92 domain-containing protein [Armatimonadota bacterium]